MANTIDKPTVCVFMSTYNGEKYLQTQIESIIYQDSVDVQLWIRDDDSRDKSIEIINNYLYTGKVHLLMGSNLGFEKSFAEISRVTNDADYFAFSDQDDEWMLDRLISAIGYLSRIDGPALYGSNFWITDSNLNVERSLYNKEEANKIAQMMQKYGIFGENMYACTMVWNKSLQDILMMHMPSAKVSQDVWTQLVAEIVGAKVIFDSNETIKHRIHNNNTAGIARNNLQRLKKAFRIYVFSGITTKCSVVNEAIAAYNNITFVEEDALVKSRKLIRDLVGNYQQGVISKIKLIFSDCFKKKKLLRRLFSSLLVIINRY